MSMPGSDDAVKSKMTIKNMIMTAGIIAVIAVVITGYLSFKTISENSIGSPKYIELEHGLGLLADVLPPPMLPLEAFAIAQIAADEGSAQLNENEAKLKKLKADFYKKLEEWNVELTDSPVIDSASWKIIHNGYEKNGNEFWRIVEGQLIPAIRNNDIAAVQKEKLNLDLEFKSFMEFAFPQEKVIKDSLESYEAATLAESQRGITLITAASILLAAFVAALVAAGQAKVVSAIVRLSDVMRSLASGNLATEVPYQDRGNELGDMARSLTVFKAQAEENVSRRAEIEGVISALGKALADLAKGNLTHRIDAEFPAAFDALRTSFNDTVVSLQKTILSVKDGTEGIKSGTVDIAQASDDLSRRTENQAANLEETAAAVAEITSKVKQTASGAVHAKAVVETAKSEAGRGGEVVRKAVDAMQQIEQSSQRITHIIGVIDEIAFQTNLLALNAGVEAARAGEAGRGFAVVASEVRALAQRSADAAREIKTLLSASQDAVQQGVGLVAETGTSLNSIIERVAEINDIVAEIASNAEQQASGLQEVNTAVDQMDQVTQQNASMVEQTTAATRALNEQSVQLSLTVASFVTAAASALSRPVQASTPKPVPAAAKPARRLPAAPRVRSEITHSGPSVALKSSPALRPSPDEWQEF